VPAVALAHTTLPPTFPRFPPAGSGATVQLVRASTSQTSTPFVSHLNGLSKRTRAANWDCEGANAIPFGEWVRALDFYLAVSRRLEADTPHPSACADGTTHLRWTRAPRVWIELEQRDGVFAVSILRGEECEVIEPLDEATALRIVVDFLRG
jgi:hypothetical protein